MNAHTISSFALVLACAVTTGCTEKDPAGPAAAGPAAVSPAAARVTPPQAWVAGDARRGKELVQTFECARCHEGTGMLQATFEKDCVRCHQDVLSGKLQAPAPMLAKWRSHVSHVRDIPSLAGIGDRLRPEWIEGYLLHPHDVRPNLAWTMPRLALSEAQAKDVATYFASLRTAPSSAPTSAGNAAHGRELVVQRACGACHVMTGAEPLPLLPEPKDERGVHRSEVSLAPDLRFVRERFQPAELAAWLVSPAAKKPGTLMPSFGFTEAEARDVASYLLESKLAEAAPKAIPARLPVLERRVMFAEVYERVLGRTCRHCHTDPDGALGDGGPGNTGGFGFAPRGLDVSTYRGTSAGVLDPERKRHSLFEPLADGTPRLLASLLARQAEEAGRESAEIRGMPLGLPALAPEEIQLVESWIAQGRPK